MSITCKKYYFVCLIGNFCSRINLNLVINIPANNRCIYVASIQCKKKIQLVERLLKITEVQCLLYISWTYCNAHR